MTLLSVFWIITAICFSPPLFSLNCVFRIALLNDNLVSYCLDTMFLGDYLIFILFYLFFAICFCGDMSDITIYAI